MFWLTFNREWKFLWKNSALSLFCSLSKTELTEKGWYPSRGKVHNVCNSFQAVLFCTIDQSQADIFQLSCWCCGIKGEFSDKIGIVLPGTWWRAGAGWAWWINDLSFTFLGKKSQFINTSSWYTAAAGAAAEVVYCQQYNRVISSFILVFAINCGLGFIWNTFDNNFRK